jgi:hypothetical protein
LTSLSGATTILLETWLKRFQRLGPPNRHEAVEETR